MDPWKKEIPIGNHHFQVPAVNFWECSYTPKVLTGSTSKWWFCKFTISPNFQGLILWKFGGVGAQIIWWKVAVVEKNPQNIGSWQFLTVYFSPADTKNNLAIRKTCVIGDTYLHLPYKINRPI